jgi:hypothetical protein
VPLSDSCTNAHNSCSLAKQLTSEVPAILDVVPHFVTDIFASVLAILDVVIHFVTDIFASVLAILDVVIHFVTDIVASVLAIIDVLLDIVIGYIARLRFDVGLLGLAGRLGCILRRCARFRGCGNRALFRVTTCRKQEKK